MVGSVFVRLNFRGRIGFARRKKSDKGEGKAASQSETFQRRWSVAVAGRLPSYKHASAGIVWPGNDYSCFDCPHEKMIADCDYLTHPPFIGSGAEMALDISLALSLKISYTHCRPFEFLPRAILLFY